MNALAWRNRRRERGAAAVVALVALVVTALLVAAGLRLVTLQHRALRVERYRDQAGWLADAGIELAAIRLEADPTYPGETWKLSAAQLGLPDSGEITIRVAPVDGSLTRKAITAESVYPSSHAPQVRARRELHWNKNTGED